MSIQLQSKLSRATVDCISNEECEHIFRRGSECINNLCTNPFHNGGCLKSYLPDWHKKRVCNSDDPIYAIENGYCIQSPLHYMEVRVSSNNWEAGFFQAWILQIILSEMLDVPVSVETGLPGQNVDLYNIDSRMDYGKGIDFASLELGKNIGDCRKVKTNNATEYQACSHINPEFWSQGVREETREQIKKRNIESLVANGGIAEQFWYIPKFAAERDPSLLSYLGLSGKANRRKVASRFKFPTTWKDYCDQVSRNNCTKDDKVAARYPEKDEQDHMFKDGLYTGHFRLTEKNDCNKYPKTCTGFIADYPCGWWSFTPQQAYHSNIPLDSYYSENGDYSYSQMVQIWAAANATKSDVIMMWWNPDLIFQKYFGTEAEFTRVMLPTPTQECVENRIYINDRCGMDLSLKVGDPQGACDYTPEVVQKAIGGGLFEITHSPEIPEALWSPAYDVMKNLQITSLQIGQIMEHWLDRGTDLYGFDARDSTCKWVAENMDIVEGIIPKTFPRVIEKLDSTGSALFNTAQIMACVAILLVIVSSALIFKRQNKAMYYLQKELLLLVMLGLLLIAIGSLLLTVPPVDWTCVASIWFISIGYVLEIVPILIRIVVINKLVSVGRHMKRVRLRRRKLFGQVLGVCFVICVFLTLWTKLDPPKLVMQYELTEHTTSTGERIIVSSDYCQSEWIFWYPVNLSWQLLFLLAAGVLSFLASRAKEDMNGVKSISKLVAIQTIFIGIRAAMFLAYYRSSWSTTSSTSSPTNNAGDGFDETDLTPYQTLAISMECIFVVLVFILPYIFDNNAYDQIEQLPDLFLNTTIIFADISGFTAWCSQREPVQVFKFLDDVYGAFDKIADIHNIFKVETVGDCYVAASGLPEPQVNHAVAMAKFADDIMNKMNRLTKELEVLYGPDTADLSLRIGIHSGPVTGGFLTKGKGSRFQLFGDTMNITERIEASGMRGRIHLSEATANILLKAGKEIWVKKRDDVVHAKGKGKLNTYWLERISDGGTSERRRSFLTKNVSDFEKALSSSDNLMFLGEETLCSSPDQIRRLIEWNVQVLKSLLEEIISRRNTVQHSAIRQSHLILRKRKDSNIQSLSNFTSTSSINSETASISKMPIEQVKEIITLPAFDSTAIKRARDNHDIELPQVVIDQLKDYVTMIAGMYRANPFHNFEHASHVVMAVTKHLSRIVAPTDLDLCNDQARLRSKTAASLHDHTYGITSDPLTQFACVYSALIHDVDHPGVPNPQLMKEDQHLTAMYQGRSVAEQNSFDLAWNLLMEDRFIDLRNTIYGNPKELNRFRQLVINSIMATDLGDKELKALRNKRWDRAFHLVDQSNPVSNKNDDINRKATIVIEHLIQASDVSHTMQHWHVYRKWNEQLFRECYRAYRYGRSETNPADGWYEGEIGFFDFYIIPLAKKLDNCGVFGVSSDENLSYAVSNRAEWEERGREIVAEYMQKVQQNVFDDETSSCDDTSVYSGSNTNATKSTADGNFTSVNTQIAMTNKLLTLSNCH